MKFTSIELNGLILSLVRPDTDLQQKLDKTLFINPPINPAILNSEINHKKSQ